MFNDIIMDVGGNQFEPDPFEVNPDRKGITGVNSDGVIVVAFNENFCSSEEDIDILGLVKTIIHEGIHADLYQYVSDNLPDGQTLGSIGQSTFDEVFNELFQLVCNDTNLTDQHQVMMNNSIDLITQALYEFNDEIGEVEDYEYLAWLGIWKNDPCVESVISTDEINALKDRYENNVTLSSLINCN